MSGIAIQAEGLSKRYKIGAVRERPDTLRDQIASVATRGARRAATIARGGSRDGGEEAGAHIWALRDVSFDIAQGQVVGIIGRNGAGKSTLLKVLSRITEPTAGTAAIHGRVGSLLEVGTGFHPELTGRENVLLNGSIIGMRRVEIRRKFDEIVAFAGLEEFIDTPVKRYSSGMYVRLAFAVAAFLEPEILLVDEVLAVGDSQFQQKCIGKMGSVAREGRTVLLVSHNMGAVNQLCPHTIWLDQGRVREMGETAPVVRAYLRDSDAGDAAGTIVFPDDPSKDSQLVGAQLLTEDGEHVQRFSCDQAVVLELEYLVRRRSTGLYACAEIDAADGTPVLVSYSHDMTANPLDDLAEGLHRFRVTIPPRSLAAGDYRVHFSVARGLKGTVEIDNPGIVARFGLDDVSTIKGNRRLGYLSTLLDWEVEPAARLSDRAR